MDIIKNKTIYFLISLIVLIPGTFSLVRYGLNVSIDFTGGSRFTWRVSENVNSGTFSTIQSVFQKEGIKIASIQKSGSNQVIIRTVPIDEKKHAILVAKSLEKIGTLQEQSFETVGPTIGSETTMNAVKATIFASLLIILYIAWSFRKVPKPASSWRFGVCAIVALIHDVLVLLGAFSLLGHFYHVEIDSLFVTAVLTVIGFSVHDTIVVFDRIRENLRRMPGSQFGYVVNESILQTLARSLNTSLTVVLVLSAMLLFGGESIRWFVVALLVGIVSGTYSSIFNAAPLLVWWEEWSRKKVSQ